MIRCVDFFSGCGGTSAGFSRAGIEILVGVDNDPDAAKTYKSNFPDVCFLERDIRELTADDLATSIDIEDDDFLLFSACAPCQPFTKHRRLAEDPNGQSNLLSEFLRFVDKFKPDLLFLENVPGIAKSKRSLGPFDELLNALDRWKYWREFDEFDCWEFGVPQKRRRFVLIASRMGPISFPLSTHGPGADNPRFSTVREWISDLPEIEAGEEHQHVPNHRAAYLSNLNLRRIKATPEGGSRLDWPNNLELECHSNGFKGYSDVYGRLRWDAPASALTTRCISLSNGRYGHPNQNRAISAREAACLQTFPREFEFFGSLNSVARQIGNAVPVLVSQKFGENFVDHVRTYANTSQC